MPVRRKLIAGNWKMNGSVSLAKELINTIKEKVQLDQSSCQVAICPPFTLLGAFGDAAQNTAVLTGAQNVYTKPSGAYTGEISVNLLKEVNATYCIIGHSERRTYFGETDELVNEKTKILLENGIRPIVCVGETLEEREAGNHEKVVIDQINKDLSGISADQLMQCVIAYEPVWAIGTGKTATPEQANQMHTVIRAQLAELFSQEKADQTLILYGGSMNAKNADSLLQQSDIDGGLIGGASLKPDDFCVIIQAGLSN